MSTCFRRVSFLALLPSGAPEKGGGDESNGDARKDSFQTSARLFIQDGGVSARRSQPRPQGLLAFQYGGGRRKKRKKLGGKNRTEDNLTD